MLTDRGTITKQWLQQLIAGKGIKMSPKFNHFYGPSYMYSYQAASISALHFRFLHRLKTIPTSLNTAVMSIKISSKRDNEQSMRSLSGQTDKQDNQMR